jgi:hypothetical protein
MGGNWQKNKRCFHLCSKVKMKSALIYNFQSHQDLPTYSYFDTGVSNIINNESLALTKEFEWSKFNDFLTNLEGDDSLIVNLNFSGQFLRHLSERTEELERLAQLIKNGRIEVLASPYYDSLSCLFSKELFEYEIHKQTALIEKLFSVKATGFMNSGLLFNNSLAPILFDQGFSYAIVPKIDWFIPKGSNQKVFQSKELDFRLVISQFSQDEEGDFNVIRVNNAELLSEDSIGKLKGEQVRLSDQIQSNKSDEIYSLPDLVAEYSEGETFESIIGNNLQKDFLRRLNELSAKSSLAKNDGLKDNLLWLGSVHHFHLLSTGINSVERYKNYTTLQNLLYDLEIELR